MSITNGAATMMKAKKKLRVSDLVGKNHFAWLDPTDGACDSGHWSDRSRSVSITGVIAYGPRVSA
jgi:hypothetical protein